MSTKIMLEVARHSTAKGNAKLILLLLASYAHPDGTHAEMSLSTIAREAGISRRQVNTIVHFLAETGHVTLESSAGAHGTNRYAIHRPWLNEGNHFPRAITSLGAITAPLGKPLPTNDKENKDLKRQSCAMAALGKPLPHDVGQSLPQQSPTDTAVSVTPEAVHVVSTYGLGSNFFHVLQGKDPAEPSNAPSPVTAVDRPPVPISPRRQPRKVAFDESRFTLGDPCTDDPTHRYGDTGKTVRSLKTQDCRLCALAAKKVPKAAPHSLDQT